MKYPKIDEVWTNFGFGQTLEKYELVGLSQRQFAIQWTDSGQNLDVDKQWTKLTMNCNLVDKLRTKFGLGQKLDKVGTSPWLGFGKSSEFS